MVVRHSNQTYEHPNHAKNPALQKQKNVVWSEVQAELQFLHQVITAPKTTFNSSSLERYLFPEHPPPG